MVDEAHNFDQPGSIPGLATIEDLMAETNTKIIYAVHLINNDLMIAGPYTAMGPVKAFFNKKISKINSSDHLTDTEKQMRIDGLSNVYKVAIYTPSLVVSPIDIGNLTHNMVKERVCILGNL